MQAETHLGVREVLKRYWGYDTLRPLQAEAIAAGLERRDSLVVMPTGGGKSLCYQIPPVVANRTDIVVSPLISLMKDQVDGLRQCGYPAAALYTGTRGDDQAEIERGMLQGRYRLIFMAPERLLTPKYLDLVWRMNVAAFAIDEAHCISHWGHDFRPEYRRLAGLKTTFPRASVHAFTATATERVRNDIAVQLGLSEPRVLVGDFDRPNLVYRVVPRVDLVQQCIQVLRRHEKQAAIIYCISRKETEELAAALRGLRVNAAHYHAGMDADARRQAQDAFAEERVDVIVATVAFGMGIDRSDVRCVIHAAMPKSIEHYQQETGRAGRDGLEAECVLLYSQADVLRWEKVMAGPAKGGAGEAERPAEVSTANRELLGHMRGYASALFCRHRGLVEYFGQKYPKANCSACDVCLNETDGEDATIPAQKILSCVARVEQRFGLGHVVQVLRGGRNAAVRQCHHEKLSTFGILKDTPEEQIKNMAYQLIDLGLLDRSPGDRPVLKLNAKSWEVLRGERTVKLVRPPDAVGPAAVEEDAWEGVERGLFERLREVRRSQADQRGVPPFVILGDATLRELARYRPTTLAAISRMKGFGEQKLAEFGAVFTSEIAKYCRANDVSMNVAMANAVVRERESRRSAARKIPAGAYAAFAHFDDGETIEQVMQAMGRARSTVCGYLVQYVGAQRPKSIDRWVPPAQQECVLQALEKVELPGLRPIFEFLQGAVSYDAIRLTLVHHRPARAATEQLQSAS